MDTQLPSPFVNRNQSPAQMGERLNDMFSVLAAVSYSKPQTPNSTCYSAPVGERSIAISLSVCVSGSISLEPLDRSSRFFVQIPCGPVVMARSSTGGVAIRLTGFMDDVTFGRSGPYGDAWKAEPLIYYH